MKHHSPIKALLPPVVLACILSIIFLLPKHDQLLESAISPHMPLGYELDGWYARKLQESEQERNTLAADTRFSKASYTALRATAPGSPTPQIVASIVYSGNDMNASIHRPERCLPAQGHVDLKGSSAKIKLSHGQSMQFTRLASRTPAREAGHPALQHINYYVFVGHHSICSSHLGRTLQDMYDRILHGYVQRWAYFQIGTYWGGGSGISEQQADTLLQQLIAELTPRLLDNDAIKN